VPQLCIHVTPQAANRVLLVDGPICCLIRAENTEAAADRLNQTAQKMSHPTWQDEWLSQGRVVPVCGDLASAR